MVLPLWKHHLDMQCLWGACSMSSGDLKLWWFLFMFLSRPQKPSPAPPPVVRMPTNPSIADVHSPRKFSGRGRGRAYLMQTATVSSRPGLACPPEPETARRTQAVHQVSGLHRLPTADVGLPPTQGPSAPPPNHVGLGRGLNACKYCPLSVKMY